MHVLLMACVWVPLLLDLVSAVLSYILYILKVVGIIPQVYMSCV